jgi:hypothetical protein
MKLGNEAKRSSVELRFLVEVFCCTCASTKRLARNLRGLTCQSDPTIYSAHNLDHD